MAFGSVDSMKCAGCRSWPRPVLEFLMYNFYVSCLPSWPSFVLNEYVTDEDGPTINMISFEYSEVINGKTKIPSQTHSFEFKVHKIDKLILNGILELVFVI